MEKYSLLLRRGPLGLRRGINSSDPTRCRREARYARCEDGNLGRRRMSPTLEFALQCPCPHSEAARSFCVFAIRVPLASCVQLLQSVNRETCDLVRMAGIPRFLHVDHIISRVT